MLITILVVSGHFEKKRLISKTDTYTATIMNDILSIKLKCTQALYLSKYKF